MCLVEWMHNCLAVEGVIDHFDFLITVASQVHIECKLTELLEVKVLVCCLLIEHGLEDGSFIQGFTNSV